MKRLYKLEKRFFDWILINKYAVFSLMVVSMGSFAMLYVPYVNLFVSRGLVVFVIVFSVLLFFDINSKTLIKTSITLVIISALLYVLKRYENAEDLFDYVYLLFTVISLKLMLGLTKD